MLIKLAASTEQYHKSEVKACLRDRATSRPGLKALITMDLVNAQAHHFFQAYFPDVPAADKHIRQPMSTLEQISPCQST